MKMSRRILTLFVIALLSVLPTLSRAQDDTSDTNTSDSDQNATTSDSTNVPLKELMLKSDQVTNTVGIVLTKISTGLWAGVYEVTQKSYQKVMGSNPSAFPGGDRPVDSVTWNDAVAFCQKLTEKEQKAGELPKRYAYTLPTQAQWEQLVDEASLSDAGDEPEHAAPLLHRAGRQPRCQTVWVFTIHAATSWNGAWIPRTNLLSCFARWRLGHLH